MSTNPNDLEDFRNKKLADEIQEIHTQLTSVAVKDHAILPERTFVQVFLPFFAGDEKLMYKADLTTWTNFAGGPYREVEVVDAQGKTLFTVPPVFDRTAINPVANSTTPIAHVVATAQQYARIHPTQGLHHLNAELTKRALIMKVPASVLKNLEIWNAIFERYGRPPLVAVDSITEPTPTSIQGNDDFDFEPI